MSILSNEMMIFFAILIGIFLIGYLIGNFSPSYLFGRWFGNLDIRQSGSGNLGATNVIRVLGWKYGIPVFILDALKGLAAATIGASLGGVWGTAAAAIGVVVGHDMPFLLNFRGGKGIASTTGIFLYLFPVPTLVGIAIFLLIILTTRMVSLGSLVFVFSLFLFTTLSGQPFAWVLLASGLAVFAFVRHKDNIHRILRGCENKLTLKIKRVES